MAFTPPILEFIADAVRIFSEMAPYLLLGFTVAGILHVVLPTGFIERHLGGGGRLPVFKAALIGVPLPLCSCSVIPVTAALIRHGASPSAAMAFLLATPQTGVDSILVTYSLLGPLFTVFRPVVALLMGCIGGSINSMLDARPAAVAPARPAITAVEACGCHASTNQGVAGGADCRETGQDNACGCNANGGEGTWVKSCKTVRMLRYALVTLPRDLGKPLLIGMVAAAAITALVPHDFLAPYLGRGILPMLVAMALGIPMYVCATASVPIAAALITTGVSPGAALVFLITGPVTNAAEISALWKLLGRRTVFIYLATVVIGSLLAGWLLDTLLLITGWRIVPLTVNPATEQVSNAAAVIMLVVFANALWPRRRQRQERAADVHAD